MRLKKHEKPLWHKKLEAKLSSNAVSVYNHIILGAEKTNLNKRHTNDLCIWKFIHSVYFVIQINIAVSESYDAMMNYMAV